MNTAAQLKQCKDQLAKLILENEKLRRKLRELAEDNHRLRTR